MRRRPPKSHLYTLISLIVAVAITGILLIKPDMAPKSVQTQQNLPESIPFESVDITELDQLSGKGTNSQLQGSGQVIQPAGGSNAYKNFMTNQNTYQPQTAR